MNLNGCAAVQCTSGSCSHNPCGLHACTCLACGTLAGFLLSVAGVFRCQPGDNVLGRCGGFCDTFWAQSLSGRDASNTLSQADPKLVHSSSSSSCPLPSRVSHSLSGPNFIRSSSSSRGSGCPPIFHPLITLSGLIYRHPIL